MAEISFKGLDEFRLSLEEVANLPDGIIDEMLNAGGSVVVKAQKQKLLALGLYDSKNTGPHLVDSIVLHKKRRKKSAGDVQRYVLIYPEGKHGEYTRRLVTKKYKRSKHGRTYTVGGDVKDITNNDVGFVHEFGAHHRGIPAKNWMATANEESAAKTTAAQAAVYDRWLQSKNL